MVFRTSKRFSAFFVSALFFMGIQSLFIQGLRAHDVHYAPNNTYYDQQNHRYGSVDASPETRQFVHEIQKKLNMGNVSIPVKWMNDHAIAEKGSANACVCDGHLFLDEQWFMTLSSEQKTFLIGHELAHVREGHGRRLVQFRHDACATESERKEWAQCSRSFEKEADLIAAKELHAAQGGVALVKSWMKMFGSSQAAPLDAHPTFAERKKYLLAELALQKVVTGQVKNMPTRPQARSISSKRVVKTTQARPRSSVA